MSNHKLTRMQKDVLLAADVPGGYCDIKGNVTCVSLERRGLLRWFSNAGRKYGGPGYWCLTYQARELLAVAKWAKPAPRAGLDYSFDCICGSPCPPEDRS